MMSAEVLASILAKAELLAGHDLGGQGDLLVEMAAQRACAYCQREDVPPGMEQAVAALALALQDGGEVVKSLTRGDTSITYDISQGPATLLAPFRRLGTLKEGSV